MGEDQAFLENLARFHGSAPFRVVRRRARTRRGVEEVRVAIFAPDAPVPHWHMVTLDLGRTNQVRPGTWAEIGVRAPRCASDPPERLLRFLDELHWRAHDDVDRGPLRVGRLTLARTVGADFDGGFTFRSDSATQPLAFEGGALELLDSVYLCPAEATAAMASRVAVVVDEVLRRSPRGAFDLDREPIGTADLRALALAAGSDLETVDATFLHKRVGFLWQTTRIALAVSTARLLSLALPARLAAGRSIAVGHCGFDLSFRRGHLGVRRIPEPSGYARDRQWTSGWQLDVSLDPAGERDLVEWLASAESGAAFATLPRLELGVVGDSEISEYLNVLGGRRATRRF